MGLRDDLMGSLGSDAPPATLASSMRQAGFRCCATPEALTQLFKLHNFGPKNPPRSSDVAAVLAMMMQPAGYAIIALHFCDSFLTYLLQRPG